MYVIQRGSFHLWHDTDLQWEGDRIIEFLMWWYVCILLKTVLKPLSYPNDWSYFIVKTEVIEKCYRSCISLCFYLLCSVIKIFWQVLLVSWIPGITDLTYVFDLQQELCVTSGIEWSEVLIDIVCNIVMYWSLSPFTLKCHL